MTQQTRIDTPITPSEEEDKIADYVQTSPRWTLRSESAGRHFFMTDPKGNETAYLWFKMGLGGFRLSLADDGPGGWLERGPVQSLEQLKQLTENQ